jgi:hypothetical protein
VIYRESIPTVRCIGKFFSSMHAVKKVSNDQKLILLEKFVAVQSR